MEVTPLSGQQPPLAQSPNSLLDKSKWPRCNKTYNSKWEADPLLKTWIGRHPRDNGKAVCRFCQSVIRAHKNDLLEHTRTLKHQRNFMQNSSPEEYNSFVMELNELRKETHALSKKRASVHKMEHGATNGGGNSNGSGGGGGGTSSRISLPISITSTNSNDGHGGDLSSTWEVKIRNGNNNHSSTDGVSLGDDDVLDGEDLWQESEDFMAADSPSDLVSVILEEQQSPNSSSNSGTSSHSHSQNNVSEEGNSSTLLSHHSGCSSSVVSTTTQSSSNNNIPSTSFTLVTTNHAQYVQNGSTPSLLEPVVVQSSSTNHHQMNAKAIKSAIEECSFSLPELCSIVKSAFGQIEKSLTSMGDGGSLVSLDTSSLSSLTPSNCLTVALNNANNGGGLINQNNTAQNNSLNHHTISNSSTSILSNSSNIKRSTLSRPRKRKATLDLRGVKEEAQRLADSH